jgi:hypothetical protein
MDNIDSVPIEIVPQARPRMLIGTFHKTGTKLIHAVFRQISTALNYKFWTPDGNDPPEDSNVMFHQNSGFRPNLMRRAFPTALVFRDPRDVIISGAFYHLKQETPGDAWLHVPNARFGGMTYQQKIASLPNDEERLIFEMDHKGGATLRHMQRFLPPRPHVMLARFEELVSDPYMFEYHRMFAWLGIPPEHLGRALNIAYRNSLFSGNVNTPHVRSGRPGEWRDTYTPRTREAFRERFSDLAERCGYPAD